MKFYLSLKYNKTDAKLARQEKCCLAAVKGRVEERIGL